MNFNLRSIKQCLPLLLCFRQVDPVFDNIDFMVREVFKRIRVSHTHHIFLGKISHKNNVGLTHI
jgi:hypothetical protein